MNDMNRRDFLKYSGAGLAGRTLALHLPFLGPRKAFAAVAPNSFTIGVISDTQNYTDYGFQATNPPNNKYFLDQTQYLLDHMNDMNLAFVTHVGDVVQHGDGTNGSVGDTTYGAGSEWERAKAAMDILASSGVPFGLSIGNHDYDNYSYTAANGNHPLKSNVMWKRYFGSGSPYFAGKVWYGGASDDMAISPGISSYQTFCAGGKKFLHISLEMEAGPSALAWAQSVIDLHKGYATIVTTHDYLSPPSNSDSSLPLVVAATRNAASTSYLKYSPTGIAATGTEWNDAQGVWDKFIKLNDQIFMVLCGHSWGSTVGGVSKAENIRIDNNVAGNPVYQILSDYQGNTKAGSKGGDGWFRFMEFDMDSNNIHFYTYSILTNNKAGQNGETTFNEAPTFSDFSLVMPTQVLNAPSQFSVDSSGFVYSRATRLYTGTLNVTNASISAVESPVAVALSGLTSGVTLVNSLGLRNGDPYTTVTNSGLAAGASLSIPVQFSDPSNAKINFTPVVFQQ